MTRSGRVETERSHSRSRQVTDGSTTSLSVAWKSPRPRWSERLGRGRSVGNLERGADVALASSCRGEIDGEDDRLEAGIRGRFDERLGEAAVA